MTVRFRLSEVDCVSINNVDHLLHRHDDTGIVLQRCDDGTTHLSFTHDQLVQLLASPDVQLKRGYFTSGQAARRLRCDHQYLSSLAPDIQEKLLWKTTYCHVFLEVEAKGEICRTLASIVRALPEITKLVDERETVWQMPREGKRSGKLIKRRLPPSATTLRNWIRQYEACGESPLALLRKRRSDLTYSRKFDALAETLLAACVTGYLSRNEPSQQMIVDSTTARFTETNKGRAALGQPPFPVPAARTIRRRIGKLDPFEVVARRKGFDVAKRMFAFYENGISAAHPFERIEMDEWNVDVASLFGNSGALDPLKPEERARFEVGRRWIYVALDCATRCVLSLRIVANPSAYDAVRALELVTLDKTPIARAANCESAWDFWGGIGSFVTDQGSAFTSVEFRTAVTDLYGTYEAPPAGVPKLRGSIERIFGTFGSQLAPFLIGRTFSNPQERGEYPSEQWAALTDDELAEIFTTFIVDIYHNTPHAGLNGETPANAWKRLTMEQGVTPPPDANRRRVVFGIPQERKLGRHGVLVHGIHYSCPELQQALLRGYRRAIPVRVDPCDLSCISVFANSKWHPAQAVSDAVAGLSLAEWQGIVRDLRSKYRGEAALTEDVVRRARGRIRAIDERARELMRIQPDRMTAADLERLERNLFLGLRIRPDTETSTDYEPGSGDLFGDVIGAPPSNDPEDPRASFKPGDGKRWTLSDD